MMFAALIVPSGTVSVPAWAGANIQMLPPVTEGTTTACPPGTAHMLTWDEQTLSLALMN
jgi:hypothetical protein